MRNLIRKLTPQFLLNWYRSSKKKAVNAQLEIDKSNGVVLTKHDLIQQFKSIGIEQGDNVLVHSSLSKIGYVENGPKDVVEALLEVVGPTGNLLMPNSPNAEYQINYIQHLSCFDVQNSPSKLGSISEYFRKLPNAVRSAHPTEPVSCIGPDAAYFTKDHFGELTPYTAKSPFFRISEKGGKIIYLGVTFDNAGTNLHTLEDAVSDFKFPVYFPDIFNVKVRFENGEEAFMKTKVHNPEQSKKRKCDGLIPLFEQKGVLKKVQIGKANTLLVDAKGLLDTMIEEYTERGVTMYTPNGSE
jgi:aminoglycoside 3-N-acetyltransferase